MWKLVIDGDQRGKSLCLVIYALELFNTKRESFTYIQSVLRTVEKIEYIVDIMKDGWFFPQDPCNSDADA